MQNEDASSKKLKDLGSGRILPLLFRYAWPALVTMTLNQLYNTVDRIYIGQGCGPDAIAGLALTFPVMGALAAIGVLIGMGSSAVLSIALGEGDADKAERALGQCVALKMLFGALFPPLMYFFGIDPIIALMAGADGATPETVNFARQYLSITIFFNIFSHLAFGLSATMRAEGSPLQSMRAMVAGFAANLILDPVFIFWLDMGVAGAAWATNIAMMIACASAFRHYVFGRPVVKLRAEKIRIYRDLAPRALSIGLSPCLMQMMGALICFSLNHAFTRWSGTPEEGTIQICAFGISNSVAFMFLMPTQGVQQGLAPIIGFNWGAKNHARVRRALDIGTGISAVCITAAFAVMELFPAALSRAFAADETAVAAAARALRISNVMIWTIFVNIVATTYFQSVGRPRTAILLSILRQCVVLLPVVWILPYFMDDKILAIWLAIPISDAITAIASLPVIVTERRNLRLAAARTTAAQPA